MYRLKRALDLSRDERERLQRIVDDTLATGGAPLIRRIGLATEPRTKA